jgi:hypothetical protein
MADLTAGSSLTTYPGRAGLPAALLGNTLNTALNNQGAAAVANLIDLEAGMFVMLVSAKVITAEGGTLTIDVGDGSVTDRYLNGEDGNAAAGTIYTSQNMTSGAVYSAADTLDVISNDAADAAIIRLRALAVQLYPDD